MAYRTADHERWQQLDFVIGYEIRLSGNHPCEDVCDRLAGVYPKSFKFTGWHPFCRCTAIPKLADKEEFIARQRAKLKGEEVPADYGNEIAEMPESFDEWVEENKERIENAKTEPYFIRDNPTAIEIATQKNVEAEFVRLTLRERYDRAKASGWDVEGFDYFAESPATKFDFAGFKKKFDKIVSRYGIDDMDYEILGLRKDEFRLRISGGGITLMRDFKRTTDGLCVRHVVFEMPRRLQGNGISKATFRALYWEYKRMEVQKLTVHANMDIGGYTWSRYGFCAVDKSEAIKAVEYDGAAIEVVNDYYKKKGLSSETPFPMKLISEKLGKDALLNSSWDGVLDFSDPNQLAVFKSYLGLK